MSGTRSGAQLAPQDPGSSNREQGRMSVALIGPNDAHRRTMAQAISSSGNARVREFLAYPSRLADVPRFLNEPFDIVMIDVDSDQSYALQLVEKISASGSTVMVYSMRDDADLLMQCMRAGARDFLPLPIEKPHGGPVQVSEPEPEPAPVAPEPQADLPPRPRPVTKAQPLRSAEPLQAAEPLREEPRKQEPKPEPETGPRAVMDRRAAEQTLAFPNSHPAVARATAAPRLITPAPEAPDQKTASMFAPQPVNDKVSLDHLLADATEPERQSAAERRRINAEAVAKAAREVEEQQAAEEAAELETTSATHRDNVHWWLIALIPALVVAGAAVYYLRPALQPAIHSAQAVSHDTSDNSSDDAQTATESTATNANSSANLIPLASPVKPTANVAAAPQRPRGVANSDMDAQLAAPSQISIKSDPKADEPPPSGFAPGEMESGSAIPSAAFKGKSVKVEPDVHAISSGVAAGMILHKDPVEYPAIARTAKVTGTVVIGATITKDGTLDGLHVVSGPRMLQSAALESVRHWRYKPYMLNNEPISVDTTISIVFKGDPQ